jgi:hypothetical protein
VKRGYLLPLLAILLLAALPLLAACTAAHTEGLPEYAYRSDLSLKAYQIAVAQGELLAQMPCYCGCGADPRYKNLRDCFLDANGEFNSHAANCLICQQEAQDASQWREEGLSTKQIRERIDQNYEGRGKPTDTPPVVETAKPGDAG